MAVAAQRIFWCHNMKKVGSDFDRKPTLFFRGFFIGKAPFNGIRSNLLRRYFVLPGCPAVCGATAESKA